VDGRIVEVHPDFVPGGFIDQGETVVQIEPEDYENLLRQRESELLQAKTDLQLELGRQEIARQDFQLFEDIVSTNDVSLVLRQPQLAAAKIRVDAAQAAVDQAKLDLERTTLKSPFDAQILSRSANLGSQVSSGTPIARILGIDTYWVMATVPLSKIPFLHFGGQRDGSGAMVELRNRSTWPTGVTRSGHLFKLVGSLDDTTRLARVVIEVDDPLARSPESEGLPSLLVGEYLEVRIKGKPIRNVIRLNRAYVRNQNTAWVMDAGNQLQVRDLEIVFTDAEHAYVREGLNDGDLVVTTHLSTVTDGAALRREEADPAGEPETMKGE
jgi:RND family efflux transporter MFP subunit